MSPMTRSRFGWLTAVVLVLLAGFVGTDLAARLTAHRYGETASMIAQRAGRAAPWVVRPLIVAGCALLASHLGWGWPL
jgi:hypothetical protein